MAAIGLYDAKKVTVIVGNREITGFAEGTFVNASASEDAVSSHVSPQGDVAFAVKNNSLGEVTFTLNQTSPSLEYLNSIFKASDTVPVWVYSNNRIKEKVGGSQAILVKLPDVTFSDQIEAREYRFLVADYQQ